jgi:hemoglobin
MHNRAADIYNAGDTNGAYRMFQGGLIMAKPLLAHHPEAQQLIDQGMQNAERQASIGQRAHVLHKTIEDVRARLKPPATNPAGDPSKTAPASFPPIPSGPVMNPPPMPAPRPADPASNGGPAPNLLPSPLAPAGNLPPAAGARKALWDRLGGEANVAKIVDDLITLTLDDKTINFSRDGKYPLDAQKSEGLKSKLVGYVSELSSGTYAYTGKGMAEAHQGMNIQGKEFDAFVENLRIAARKNGVTAQDAEELVEKVKAARKEVVATPPGGG